MAQPRFQHPRLSLAQYHVEMKIDGCHCSQQVVRCLFRGQNGGPTNQDEVGVPLGDFGAGVAAGLTNPNSVRSYPKAFCYLYAARH